MKGAIRRGGNKEAMLAPASKGCRDLITKGVGVSK